MFSSNTVINNKLLYSKTTMKKAIKITVENSDYQHFEVLKRNRYKRYKFREFFIEGVNSIDLALQNNWQIESFLFSDFNSLSSWAKNILRNSKAEFHYELTSDLMRKISDKEDASELIAIGRIPEKSLDEIKIKQDLLIVIFDRPSNPGNLGTVIRSCNSFKVDALIITGHRVDLYDPITIRASVGSFFRLPIFVKESHKDLQLLFDRLNDENLDFQIIGTSAKTEEYINKVKYPKATILIIGNEKSGISNNYRQMCHQVVKIPIYGVASSLNVGCAASIVLYEINCQRM